MKILKPVWILSLILLCAPPLLAQWTVNLYELTQHLDSICAGSGHPLANGTEVRIYHDRNSNGPDDADTLLTICDNPPGCEGSVVRTVNYNTFGINGANPPDCGINFPGGFSTDCPPYDLPPYGLGLFGVGDTLSPNRIYLRVCFGSRHYDSEIISPQPTTIIDVEINSWTCVEAPCPGCPTPPTPAGFSASDSSCTGVNLHWHFTEALDANVDSVFLYREAQLLGRVRASQTDTTFVDTTVPDAAQYAYSAKSRRACVGGDTAFSPSVFDLGAKYPSPPNITFSGAPYGATDDSCNAVRVSWTYSTNAGVDSFVIQRNGVWVGGMPKRTPTPGVMSFIHVTTDSTRGGYRVCGWNPVCGVANCSVVDSGRANQPPQLAPTGINATDGNCNTTRVSWNTLAGATGYRVYRYTSGCAGGETYMNPVTAPDTIYNDNTSATGTVFGYKVSAVNGCGEGPKSDCNNGYRVQTPAQPSAFLASDGASCDTVRLTWNDVTQEVGYKVSRRKLSTGVLDTFLVAADTVHYFDLSAVPGDTYYYRVVAYNSCGSGPLSGTDSLGYRLAIPLQVQNVQATDSNQCWGVAITWNNLSYEDSFIVKRDGSRIGAKGANVLRFDDSTAVVGTVYSYTVSAKNRCGEGTVSDANPGNRKSRPGLVTGLAASDTSCTVIHLSWNSLANTDSFRIYRNGVYLTRVTSVTTAYNDNPAAGTYGYRILPVNTCGLGDTSAVDSGTRKAPPPAVATVTASDSSSCDTVTITWTNIANEDGYKVYRTPVAGGTTDTLSLTVPADCTRFWDVTATPGVLYNYGVRAFNSCGNGVTSTTDPGSRKARPGTPGNVQATDGTNCTGVVISWGNVAHEDSFTVFRNAVRIGRTGKDTLTFTDLTADTFNTRYGYSIMACNACGCSTSVVDSGYRHIRPGLASGLSATDTGCDSIRLTWNSLINTEKFRILRDGSVIDSVLGTVTVYNDRPPAGTFAYRILPWNVCGNGDTSVVDSGRRLAQPPAVSSIAASDSECNVVLVSWADVAGEDSFVVRRNGSPLVMVPADTLSYNDTSAVAGTRYEYEVAAYNACGAATPAVSDSGERRDVPDTVTSVGASSNSCDSILVTWSSLANVDTYYVYRDSVLLAAVPPPDTFYVDNSADSGLTYNYYVRPWNVCGYGTSSGEIGGLRLVFPSVPASLACTQTLCDRIRAIWNAADGDVDYYRLIRDGADSVIVSKDSTGYDDTTATSGVHTYRIKAVSNECGATAASAQASGERLVPAGVPDSVQATNTRCDSVVITWDEAPGDVDGYVIYETGASLDTVGRDTLRYAYQPPFGGYNYTVQAFSNECGNGDMSAIDGGARLALPTTVTGLTASVNRCDSVLLQWNAASGSFNGYIVRQDTTVLDTVEVRYYVDAPDVGSAQYDVITYSVYCDESAPTTAVTGTRLPAPVSPDSVAATDDSCNSVTVTWTAGEGTFDGYYLYRDHVRLATLLVGTQRYEEAPTSGVTYTYSVTAWDSVCGEAAALDSAQGMRQADAGVPQNLVAVNACDAVEVSWNTATGAVAEYRVYRNDTDTLLATVLPPNTFYSDTSAERGVTYTYYVSAYSTGCGETDSSNNDDGMRLPLPVQVTGLTASNNNCAGIRTDWTAVTGTEWYRIYRENALIDSVSGGSRTTTYLDTGVVPRSAHSYKVRSVNICGEGALSDSAAGTRYDVPDAVTGFFASDTSCVAVYLIWQDMTTDTGYVIYRDGSPIDTVSANDTAYVDTAAAPGAHEYVIYAMNECGLSAISETIEGTRIPGVAQVTGVAASSGLCFTIDVQWNDLPNETGYVVWRDSVRIDTLDANVTTFSDLVAPGTYNYQISALNVCGEGLISAVASGFRAWVPPQVMNVVATQDSCTSVTITWTDVAAEQFYYILRNDALIDTVDSNITSYVNQPLAPGNYIYQVQAGNYCGNGLASSTANGRVADVPAQVTGVAATNNGCTSITVTWADLTDELQYQILRNDTVIGTVPKDTLRYVDTTPAIGTHSYKVRGINICGQGALSAPATGERQGPPTSLPVISAQDSVCGQVTVYWLTVPDAINYTVFLDGDSAICTADTFFIITANPGMHAITVRPWNECGFGPLSAPKNVFFRSTVPPVTGLTADTLNCLTITLHWTDVANDTGYTILRGVDSIGHVGANVTIYVDAPTNPGTYSYRVKAINQCGYGSLSDSAAGRRRGPPAVTIVTASDTFCTQIVVSWTNVADELGYYLFQNGLPVDTVGTDTLSVTLTPPPGAYAYTVQPFNNCGLANISAPDSGHRLTVPPRVTGVAATGNRCDSVIVTWPDVLGETRYVVFRGVDSIGFVNADVVRYADAPTVGSHGYHVRADNQCGLGLLSDTATGTRLMFPLAPIDVVATDALCGQVMVAWLSGGGDVDSFKVFRGPTRVATVPGDVVATLLTNVIGTDVYTVVAHSNECGDSPSSLADNGTGHATAGVPTGVTFIAPEICDTVRLQWTASTGEVEKYMIYRDGALLDSSLTASYGDGNLPDAHNHAYRVSAKNTFCGESAQSDPATNGRVAYLMNPIGGDGDTLKCDSTYHLEIEFCLPVDSVVFYLSLRGGPFDVRVGSITPNTSPDTADVRLPLVDSTIVSNCGILVIGYRGTRIDSLPAFPLTVRCPEASADENLSEIPKDFFLDQNYPNPFNPATNIRFGVPRAAQVTIEIFDILGRKMATLINGTMPPGIHTVVWDCSACPSGMYIIRMNTGERVLLRKTLLMK
jgi:titin